MLSLDLSGSLPLFGGPRALWRRVLHASPHGTRAGMAPGAWASALLARGSPHRRRTLQLTSMQRNLDHLPCTTLVLTSTQAAQLCDWGCEVLGQLRQLPRSGLAQRGLSSLLTQLDRAYDPAPPATPWLAAPVSFHATRELDFHGTSLAAIDTALIPLVTELCQYLQVHQAATPRIDLTLHHDATRMADPTTFLPLALSQPQWALNACLHLCRLRLQSLTLPGPVLSLTVSCPHCPPRHSVPTSLLPDARLDQQKTDHLLDTLQARLGADCLAHPQLQGWPNPEQAELWSQATQSSQCTTHTPTRYHWPDSRPFWLLPRPILLSTRQEHPLWQGQPLQLQPRPERIEQGWWRLNNTRRDYFMAQDQHSARYWVYHDLKSGNWFLHGLFA